MSIAIRIARAFTGKDKILFCGYHGWYDWYLSANLKSSKMLNQHLLKGLKPLEFQIKGDSDTILNLIFLKI